MENVQLSRFKLAALLFGVFVTSFGVLSFEIGLTRIFSILLDYHFTFLVVSLALFGLGLGGVITHFWFGKKSSKESFNELSILSVAFSLSTMILALFVITFPNLNVIIQAFIMFLPFLIAGTLLSMTYKVFVGRSSVIHFADLAGAALGSLAVVFLLNWAGAVAVIFMVGIVALVSSTLFSVVSRNKLVLVISLLMMVGVAVFAQYSGNAGILDIVPASDQGKELSNFLSNPTTEGKIVDTRWSSFGQIQIVTSPTFPHQKIIFVDGGAGTSLYHFDGDFNSTDSIVPSLRDSTQYFPYVFANKGSSLVIGPGGGLDVLTALMGGVNHIYAVEVNPSIVQVVKDYSSFDGGIYSNYTNVHVTVDEGRSFLKRSDQQFDTIVLDLPVSKTSQGTFGYGLAENYLFTTESFEDYLNRLNNDGFLAVIAHNPQEIYKLVSITFEVLRAQGLYPQQIMQRIAVVAGSGHTSLPVFLLKKTPITYEQAVTIETVAVEKGFSIPYIPFGNSADRTLTALARTEVHVSDLVSAAPFNMKAPTDDNPFFYNFELGIPSALIPLAAGTIILVVLVTIAYMVARRRQEETFANGVLTRLSSKFSLFRWFCFASLGLGFMFIEVALIQKFILFLGEPALAIAVSLFSLLLAGGVGSFFSKIWSRRKQFNAFRVSLAVAILAIVYVFALPIVFNVTLNYSVTMRFLVSFALISPLGFIMGIPFPIILGYIKQEFENDAAWMWCINGAFSVLAGVIALVVAMTYGFNAVLLLGAVTYIGVFMVGTIREQLSRPVWVNPQKRPIRRIRAKKIR